MNSFFKTFWAAFLAFIAANILFAVISFLFLAAMIAAIGSSEKTAVVKDDSILKITLDAPINDSPSSSPFEDFDFQNFKPRTSTSILAVLDAIENATADSRIRGIYLNLEGGAINNANLEELRNALKEFKESGKFIISYSDTYSQGQYYLCSVADSMFMNPQGGMEWHGLASQVMFYKGLLEKVGIEPIVLRHGSFKAAVEPFIMDKMSPENKLQMNTLVNSVWGSMISDVAVSRGVDSAKLQQYASSLDIYSPLKAVELGLIDRLVYADQMKASLNKIMANDEDDDINFITLTKYITSMSTSVAKHASKNRIEIIYADGEIVDGKSSKGVVGGNTIAEKLDKARKDDRVKAVVLRVNSPGGSALASEIMWREIERLKAEKPVVVSMSGVAASGGYYIACPADVVLANRMTITGSIGVFGLLFNAEKALKDKLGITVDVARTNPSADVGSMFRSMTDSERTYIMHSIEDIYSTFVGHVAAGRNMTYAQVDSIGGGRVWSGVNALSNGLIDGFGGIKDAINLAADRAGVASDFTVHESVTVEDPFAAMLEAFTEVKTSSMKAELGEAYQYYQTTQSLMSKKGVQARMPYDLNIR